MADIVCTYNVDLADSDKKTSSPCTYAMKRTA